MNMKKILLVVAVVGLSASLGAQSLAELARKEKARREALKGRHAVVIRNSDLLAVQKTPAVEVTRIEEYDLGEGAEAEASDIPYPGIPQGDTIIPRVTAPGPVFMGDGAAPSSSKDLQAQLEDAKVQVDLLTTKMNALRQQYEYQDAMVPGYVIQQQMDETNERLLRAQANLDRIQAMVNRQRPGGRKGPGAADR